MEPQQMQERVIKMEAKLERHKESIDKLEAIADRTDAAVRRLAEQQTKQGWVMTTAGLLLAASQTGLLAALGKLFVLVP
jgi:hypothetical protein